MDATKTIEQVYAERLARVKGAAACQPVDQVPVFGPFQKYPYQFAGVKFVDAMNDYALARDACHKFLDYFQPDVDFGPIFAYPAKGMELLDWKAFRWPGHGVGDDTMYQYIEGEYLQADEYDEFIKDPSDFMQRKWAPRQFGSMAAFASTIPWRRFMWSGWMNLPFFWSTPEFQESLRRITIGAEEVGKWWSSQFQYWGEAKAKGFPMSFAGWDWPPFDILGDTLRGTHNVLADMRRRPSKLHDALKVCTDVFEEYGSGAAGAELPFVWVWVHKATREFMSDSQFAEFYWPYFKDGLMRLINKGITPVVYWEADWEKRIKYIEEMPAGKIIYHLSNTNFERAWDALGGQIALAGNVPNVMLLGGTPDDVKAYCKKIIDYTKGKPGLIMDAAIMLDEANPANLKAMFDYTREYTRQ